MGSNGIDVSNNNGMVNLAAVSGLDFVIAKCTEGRGFADGTFAHYQRLSLSLGKAFGAYHFLHAENQAGREEADFFLSHYTPARGQGVWIDYETYGTSPRADLEVVELFAAWVKEHVPWQKVGLYGNLTGMHRLLPLGVTGVVDALWLAFPNGDLETPSAPLHPAAWNIHQYETFAGIDRDYSRWSKQEMTGFFS